MEKKRYSKYSKELKAVIIAEYENTDMGYHLIAKKFGMTRDVVRGIILRNRRKNKTVEPKNTTDAEVKEMLIKARSWQRMLLAEHLISVSLVAYAGNTC